MVTESANAKDLPWIRTFFVRQINSAVKQLINAKIFKYSHTLDSKRVYKM